MRADRVAAASVAATVAFVAYTQTLLPGLDLGDTGGFQAAVLWPTTTARQAYPLYYGLATPFVALVSPANPARGLNLFSAVSAAAAVGLVAWVVAAITRSRVAGVASGLLLAFSYTFWTQAVIAEVYALHLVFVAGSLVALHRYSVQPTRARLAVFCAVYALGFGNHLSMLLLVVPCAAFVLLAHPNPRALVRPGVVAMALVIAAAAALVYTPNFLAMWSHIDAPVPWLERLAAFWFDVTKADWRESMVLGVDSSETHSRLAMWMWDVRQQFGLLGLGAAAVGAIRLWWISPPWAALLWLAYAINTIFALTYNVGDSHVFFLPGHLLTAMAAGFAAAPPALDSHRVRTWRTSGAMGAALACLLLVYAGRRGWETWPAADRHRDHRADELAARTIAGLDPQSALLVSALNWEQENALWYAGRFTQPDLAWVRMTEVLPHFPYLVRDNLAIGRDVVLTAQAALTVVSAYDGAFPLVEDHLPPAPPLASIVERLPRGTPYVLSVLTPLGEYRHDFDDFDRALDALTGGRKPLRETAAYEVLAGLVGEAPAFHQASNRPFVRRTALIGDPITIRMDAWLPTDTFRRGGFGHVIRGREPVLVIERGVSLVWFTADGTPETAYASGLYAPQPRFRIPAAVSRLARGR